MKTKMKRKYTAVEKRENRQLYLLMLPVFILIAVFCYAPMFGIVIAFQDYWPGDPFFGEGAMWVGLDNFKRFVQGEYFGRLIYNAYYFCTSFGSDQAFEIQKILSDG